MSEEQVGGILLFIFFIVFWLTVIANHREQSREVRMGWVWYVMVLLFYPIFVGWLGFLSMKLINLESMPGLPFAFGVGMGLVNFGLSLFFRLAGYFGSVHKSLWR